jgi:hypothetical protein
MAAALALDEAGGFLYRGSQPVRGARARDGNLGTSCPCGDQAETAELQIRWQGNVTTLERASNWPTPNAEPVETR